MHQYCVICHRERQRERRAAQRPPGIELAGLSAKQLGARRAVATRHARYGPTQLPPAVEAVRVAKVKRALLKFHPKRAQTHCKRGHKLTVETCWTSTGFRNCKACARERRTHRPDMVPAIGGGTVSIRAHDAFYSAEFAKKRAVLIASHPDKGGTSAKFIAAKKSLDAFLARETAWYAELGLTMPTGKRRLGAAA